MSSASAAPSASAPASDRQALRVRLLEARERFVSTAAAPAAHAALAAHLRTVLQQLEPHSLGMYWSMRSEFNAVQALAGDNVGEPCAWALPYAQRAARAMHYRAWDRQAPTLHDECGIPSCAGALTVPEVVLVPCVGYTAQGYRLGYGGGYFDRWLAAHPQVTAVGIAWSVGAMGSGSGSDTFVPAPHDQPLALIVTEQGVVG